jgi:hypothetical protein
MKSYSPCWKSGRLRAKAVRNGKRTQIQALPYTGPDEHFHGALSFVPGVQPEQAVGEMQRRTAANTLILRPKRIVFEKQKNNS